jgi:RNA polymerase sigma-70 factor (ECF subfamily)
VRETEAKAIVTPDQDGLYEEAAKIYGAAIERLARAYEADTEVCRDLVQDIHIALWRSFAGFNGRCSPRTWVYRVAHNVATSHVIRQRRKKPQTLVGLEDAEAIPDRREGELAADRRRAADRLLDLIHRLTPLDRQLILSYLEGLDAADIGEITGLSPSNIATKIHRIKRLLARRFEEGKS